VKEGSHALSLDEFKEVSGDPRSKERGHPIIEMKEKSLGRNVTGSKGPYAREERIVFPRKERGGGVR